MARRYRRRRAPRRKLRRSRNEKVGMRMSLPRGGFRISRLCDLISIKRNTSGTFTSSNTSVLSLGTAVTAVSGHTGYYDVPFAFVFRLDQLTEYTDIQNICDRYKIVRASVKFHSGNQSNVYGGAMPYIEYVNDEDDDTVPSISSLRQRMGVRQKGYNQMGQLTLPNIKPKCAGLILGNAGGTGFSVPTRSIWIDTAYSSVPHFGLKGIFRNVVAGASSTDNSNFTVDVKMTLLCADLQ